MFRSLVGRWCNKHPWSSVPFSSYATSMKPRAVGPSLLAPPPEGGLLSFTSMRPCGSHRPPLRFFYMAPSSSSSFSSSLFRRCGCVLSESPCVPNRRAARDEKGPILRRPRPTKRGKGGSSISCFSFVGLFFFVPSFFVCGCMHGPPVLARPHLTNRRGHTHGGGHGPISSSFSWLSSCPAPKSAHRKSPKIFIYDPVLYAKTRQDDMYIRQPVFSHLLWFQSCRCLVLSLHIFFYINQFTCDVCLVSKLV